MSRRILDHLDGLDRVELICSWATSPSVALRHTLAMALPLSRCDVGTPEAIELLTDDRVAQVRLSALEAGFRLRAADRDC